MELRHTIRYNPSIIGDSSGPVSSAGLKSPLAWRARSGSHRGKNYVSVGPIFMAVRCGSSVGVAALPRPAVWTGCRHVEQNASSRSESVQIPVETTFTDVNVG